MVIRITIDRCSVSGKFRVAKRGQNFSLAYRGSKS